jgi:hypothetical protein
MDHGLIIISDPGKDKPIAEIKTLQCSHCGGHFPVEPGSGRIRGFCMKCNGPVCGKECAKCIPFEKQLEILEGTRKLHQVSVGWSG